jgi:hypothetical protein
MRTMAAWTLATVMASAAVGRADDFTDRVRPVLAKYCLTCHSAAKKKGDLDLERFTTVAQVRADIRPWHLTVEQVESHEMPPKGKPQPTPAERELLLTWTRGTVAEAARASAGDPGRVIVRRLSNAEYDNTVRDLTGIDLKPARDFPGDGAAGEGFTNAGDALVMSPSLLTKYLGAAKEITDHLVLLPDGLRFSPSATRRDWTDESVAALRAFYGRFSPNGTLPLRPYLAAAVRHRDDIVAGKTTPEAAAAREKLNAKYFRALWDALTGAEPSLPLERVREKFRRAKPDDAGPVVAEAEAWQAALWRFVQIGSYRYHQTVRQLASDPTAAPAKALRVPVKPAPGQDEVVVTLSAADLAGGGGRVTWREPRVEGAGQLPLLLKDYPREGAEFEVTHSRVFADAAKYLAAAADLAAKPGRTVEELAAAHKLDAVLLGRWLDVLQITAGDAGRPIRTVPAAPLELLSAKLEKVNGKESVNGWKAPYGDLPIVVTNASGSEERIPGTLRPHAVAVHPLPDRFVAVAWAASDAGPVRVEARVTHAHPACGNGVAWRVEHRRANRAGVLAEGPVDLGKSAAIDPREITVDAGDLVVLVVDARDGNHVCDLTEVSLTVSETADRRRRWDLMADVSGSVLAGNPHPDQRGNAGVWRFAHGPAGKGGPRTMVNIPSDSLLGRWKAAAPAAKAELAGRVQALLAGPRPGGAKHPDRTVFDALAAWDGPLLGGLDLSRFAPEKPSGKFITARFDADGNLAGASVELRLPAALFRGREFVVDVALDPAAADRVIDARAGVGPAAPWDGKSPLLADPKGPGWRKLLDGLAAFRRVFPKQVSYSHVIPDDEVVCLKLYHREDEPLVRLFLDAAQTAELERLWAAHRFISRQPVVEHENLPQFIGFVTQDQPKELLAYFEGQRGPFRERAEQFERDWEAAAPKQLDTVVDFATKAYRRPLDDRERRELPALYATLRKKGMPHEEAIRTVMMRVLVSPTFLYRVERAAPGAKASPLSDWELATRLSYFLWATMPDDALRQAAAAGRLRDPAELTAQTARMLKDPKARGLAVEFGAQWLQVRDIRRNREKNEKLFPTYDDTLRSAMFEEVVLFFQDLFAADHPLADVLDADHTFLNETLARHYGVPGVSGPEWRRVDGVRKFGRGGVLTMAAVLTQQSGASRTSPVLRGNWLVDVVLGERLPKPPPNVPQLPEEEASADATVRQLVERHARIAECAACHVRIDPFGFALENYDPVGRRRDRDLAGRPVDARARLRDGTEFDGLDGLRRYLADRRAAVFRRQFCRKLLGYALGRSVGPSDGPLLDEMESELAKAGGRVTAAMQTVVRSRQFREHRGLDATRDE